MCLNVCDWPHIVLIIIVYSNTVVHLFQFKVPNAQFISVTKYVHYFWFWFVRMASACDSDCSRSYWFSIVCTLYIIHLHIQYRMNIVGGSMRRIIAITKTKTLDQLTAQNIINGVTMCRTCVHVIRLKW